MNGWRISGSIDGWDLLGVGGSLEGALRSLARDARHDAAGRRRLSERLDEVGAMTEMLASVISNQERDAASEEASEEVEDEVGAVGDGVGSGARDHDESADGGESGDGC